MVEVRGEGGKPLAGEPLRDVLDVVVEPPPFLDYDNAREGAVAFGAGEKARCGRAVAPELDHLNFDVSHGKNSFGGTAGIVSRWPGVAHGHARALSIPEGAFGIPSALIIGMEVGSAGGDKTRVVVCPSGGGRERWNGHAYE